MTTPKSEARVEEILVKFGLVINQNAMGSPRQMSDKQAIDEATQSILQLIKEARIDENKYHLSKFKGDGMDKVVALFAPAFTQRIAELSTTSNSKEEK